MNEEERLLDSLRRALRRQKDRARRAAKRAEAARSGGAGNAAVAFTTADVAPTGACFLRYANGVRACRNGLTEPACIEAASDAGADGTWRGGKSCS